METASTRRTRMRALVLFALVATCPVVAVRFAEAQGTVTTPIGSGGDEADAIALQPDGKIVVAGWSHNGSDDDVAVVRYNVDLTLDSSFDGDGIVTTSFAATEDRANAIAIQSDGKIVVAGHSAQGGSGFDFAVARYLPDGSPDGTFGTAGRVTTDVGVNSDDRGRAVAIQSDGKIVVAGYSGGVATYDFAVVRYNANGSLDTSFDGDGKLTTSFTAGSDQAEAIAIQPDGKIVVAGNAGDPPSRDIVLARYDPADGSLDAGFGAAGKVTTNVSTDDNARFLVIQADLKILLAGSTRGATLDFSLLRYDTAGVLDPGFGTGGVATTDFGFGDDASYGLAIQSDGKIVTAGLAYNGTDFDFAAARYDTNGALDVGFGTGGRATAPVGASHDFGYGVAVEADGRVILAGTSDNGSNYDVALARFCPNGVLVTNFIDTFAYRKPITIPSSHVGGSSDLVDFPVLISVTDPDLVLAAGKVQRADGADIVFREGCGLASLDHEIQKYDPGTGELIAWVRIPRLRHNLDNVVFMYYGNNDVGCSTQNPGGVWADHRAVWHMDETPPGPFVDVSANPNDGSAPGLAPLQVAGQVDLALGFEAATDRHLVVADHASLDLPTNMTVSAWVKTSSADAQDRVILAKWGATASGWQNYWLGKIGATDLGFFVDGGGTNESVTTPITDINDGSWHHVVGVADAAGTSLRIYVDGVLRNTAVYNGTSETGGEELHFANNPGWPSQFWDGDLDEARVSAVAHTSGWIRTEFNNQSAPGSFASLGLEQNAPFTYPSMYAYRKKLTVDPARVTCGSDQTNLPVLVSLVDPDLRTATDGGRVKNPSGYDVEFRDATGTVTLASEIEKYASDPANGTLVAWVRVPTVSASAPTDIYMYYGNPAVSCPLQTQNPIGVWDPSYIGVWHLGEADAGKVEDSTSNAYHGTKSAVVGSGPAPNPSAFIDGGHDFVRANSDRVEMLGTASQLSLTSFTVEAWMKTPDATVPGDYYLVSQSLYCDGNESWSLNIADDVGFLDQSRFAVQESGVQTNVYGPVVTGNQWHHLVGVRTATDLTLYIDGSLANTVPDPRAGLAIDSTSDISLGSAVCDLTNDHNGTLDEVRIATGARLGCRIETEYNNHKWPTKTDSPTCSDVNGFICVGPQEANPTAVALASFVARGYDGSVVLEWETGSETNNLGFHLHRSTSERGPYTRITSQPIPGLGSSPEGARYSYEDAGLVNGVTYFYQLEDIETTGATEMHGPVFATPGLDISGEPSPTGESPAGPRITVGDPASSRLRILSRRQDELVLELVTGGFYATPRDDGTVALEVPGYDLTMDVGRPSLPVRRTWVEAVAGRQVRIVGIERFDRHIFDRLTPEAVGEPTIEASETGIVKAGRRRHGLRRDAGNGRMYPARSAHVSSVGYQQDVKKALVEIAPLRWDDRRQRLVLTERIVVRLSFRGRDLRDASTVRPDRRVRRRDTSGVVARLVTREPGLYSVRFEEILDAGSRRQSSTSVRLSRHGESVPFHLSAPWGPGSVLYFVSDGAAANPYGVEAVYELELGVAGDVMATASATPSATGDTVPYYWERVAQEENLTYQPSLVDAPDRWLGRMLFAPARTVFPFDVSALAPASENVRLSVWLQGVSDFSADPDHHLRLYVNGQALAEMLWNGKESRRIETEFPAFLLHDGVNVLELENVGDTGAAYSVVMLDRFEMSYPRLLAAVDGRLDGRLTVGGVAEVSGLGLDDAVVLEKSESGLTWLEGAAASATGLRFRAEAGRSYLALHPEAINRVAEIRRPLGTRLQTTEHRVDYVMIGPRDFLDAARALAEHRRAQGLRVDMASTEEIFSEFGYGEERPEAIKEFLRFAYHRWDEAPRYVVLLGDATYDYKNYLGAGAVNHVPPLLVKTTYVETVSDPAYAAVNGEDLLPDFAIGRLPAATVEELQTMVAKIIDWEASPSLKGRAVLVADNPDAAGDFVGDAEALSASILTGREVEKIYLSELGATATRSAVGRAFDEGAALVNYIGHGGIHVWADENILDIDDVPLLSLQGHQPLVLTMNCLNGYFHFPYSDALAEALVTADGKGAIAAFSPSGFSVNDAAHLFHRALLEELVRGDHARLGDAVLAAQAAYAESGALPEMIAIYHLLGDPASRLR